MALEDHRRMLHDNARRVRESHKAMAKAAGMESVLEGQDDAADDMGDIMVTGDIQITQQAPEPAPAKSAPAGLSTAAKAAIAASALLGAGGLGAAIPLAILAMKDKPAPAPVGAPPSADTDTQYRLRIIGEDE